MKKIGIPLNIVGDTSIGVGISYLEFISRFGKPVIITPKDTEDPPEVDMILSPGGPDVLPTRYGAMPGFRTQKPNIFLEHFDATILPQYIERKTPVFAICRGFQAIWAMYGGHIQQHNSWHDQSKSQTDQCHKLSFTPDYQDYKKLIDKVTSRHHQCADASVGVPDELDVVAYAGTSDGKGFLSVVEIFKHKELPIFGVQFHPEDHDYSDQLCPQIIREYLNI